jgi:hypothetical protein
LVVEVEEAEPDMEAAEEAVALCLQEGLLANNVKPTALRLMPPLTVSEEEIDAVIGASSTAVQWIRVDVPKGGSCHVSGSQGSLPRVVPHNSFPDKVFT